MSASTPTLVLRVHGDSLGLPRFHDGVSVHQTYAELFAEVLRGRGWDVRLYNRSIGGGSIRDIGDQLASDTTYFGDREAGVLVLQSGIVDCAPRPIPHSVRTVIEHAPAPVRTRVVRFLHDHRAHILGAGIVFRRTPPAQFERRFASTLEAAKRSARAVFVMNIAPTTPEMDAHSPGLSASIERYNELIARVASGAGTEVVHIDVHRAITDRSIEECVNPHDGHHITPAGHALYAELLAAGSLGLLPPPISTR